MMKRILTMLSIGSLLLVILISFSPAKAALVSYEFTTTVSELNPSSPGFPSSLNGIILGDPITGTLSYDSESPPPGFPRGLDLATNYDLANASFTVDINGVIFDTWSFIYASVFDNNSPIGTSSNLRDGILFYSRNSSGMEDFKLGNLNVSVFTFLDDSLPTENIPGLMFFDLGLVGSQTPWIRGEGANLVLTPIPAAVWLFGPALVGLIGFSKRKKQPPDFRLE